MIKVLPKVTAVILNYNGYTDTIRCIRKLKQNTYTKLDIIVIDNNSSDNSVPHLRKEKGIVLIENKSNLGFTGGNNIGIKYALNNLSDYILLLNNDTIPDSNFVGNIVQSALENCNAGITGCKIYDKNGAVWFGGGRLLKKLGTVSISKVNTTSIKREVTFITGCVWFVKKEVFENIGYLNEKYFMYFEDVEFCYRAIEAGFKLYYDPSIEIIHLVSRSCNSEFSAYYTLRNRLLFINGTLDHKQLPRIVFYTTNYLKLLFFWLIRNPTYKTIRKAILDGQANKTGKTFTPVHR
jgi:hypothetical protein